MKTTPLTEKEALQWRILQSLLKVAKKRKWKIALLNEGQHWAVYDQGNCDLAISRNLTLALTRAEKIDTKSLKCCGCGTTSKSVKLEWDPFALEVHDQKVELYLCPQCWQDRKDAI